MIALKFLGLDLAICRLESNEPLPGWSGNSRFLSVTRTSAELSIVCETSCLPKGVDGVIDSGWICIEVEGPLDLTLTGILASITAPLAEAGIPVFAISSYDTDFILIRKNSADAARAVLSKHFRVS